MPGRALDDDGSLLLRFAGGARGVLIASQINTGLENDLRLRVSGTLGTLEWRQEQPSQLLHSAARRPAAHPDARLALARRGGAARQPPAGRASGGLHRGLRQRLRAASRPTSARGSRAVRPIRWRPTTRAWKTARAACASSSARWPRPRSEAKWTRVVSCANRVGIRQMPLGRFAWFTRFMEASEPTSCRRRSLRQHRRLRFLAGRRRACRRGAALEAGGRHARRPPAGRRPAGRASGDTEANDRHGAGARRPSARGRQHRCSRQGDRDLGRRRQAACSARSVCSTAARVRHQLHRGHRRQLGVLSREALMTLVAQHRRGLHACCMGVASEHGRCVCATGNRRLRTVSTGHARRCNPSWTRLQARSIAGWCDMRRPGAAA